MVHTFEPETLIQLGAAVARKKDVVIVAGSEITRQAITESLTELLKKYGIKAYANKPNTFYASSENGTRIEVVMGSDEGINGKVLVRPEALP